ncbi:hypothetical protein FEM48_Zijuj03G0040800 [Ziziphus jujuba var. spinosa]|uniref:Uncharacterized protein n=1 Tax=Ziziphus jujuba var. spinosa TaxID=714518 RepID=A0A978VN28_ZIZJJ|nr:hypothetical protein FEM48_Zijuj03G0040800 [Ziziphus jujuba var. spinosa]
MIFNDDDLHAVTGLGRSRQDCIPIRCLVATFREWDNLTCTVKESHSRRIKLTRFPPGSVFVPNSSSHSPLSRWCLSLVLSPSRSTRSSQQRSSSSPVNVHGLLRPLHPSEEETQPISMISSSSCSLQCLSYRSTVRICLLKCGFKQQQPDLVPPIANSKWRLVAMQLKNLLSLLQKRFFKTSTILSATSSIPSSSFTALSAPKTLQVDKSNAQNPQSVLSFLKSYKFDDTHIAKLISQRPSLLQSKILTNLSPKFQFLVENGFSGELLPKLIVSNSRILYRSLDSKIKPIRIRPRYHVLKVLVSKELIKHDNKPGWVFRQSETAFLDNYVFKYAGEVPNLLEVYNAAKTKAI